MNQTTAPRTAVIVLNRNLPLETDQLCDQLAKDGGSAVDVFVVESGSDPDKRSRYATWVADWPEAIINGLRYARGFNFGLANLYREGRFKDYEYFFLVCNDVEFAGPAVPVLVSEMEKHPHLGILSPCNEAWGELACMKGAGTAYVWHVNHIAWMLRRGFIEAVMQHENPDYMQFLYDGSNFHGHFCDIEVVVKGYANDWATGLTNLCRFRERTELLKTKAAVMRTTPYEENQRLVIEEGRRWMKNKYGFSSRWQIQQYAHLFYEDFFRLNPDLEKYRLLQSEAA